MTRTRPRDDRPDRSGGACRRLILGMHRLLPVFPVLVANEQRDGRAKRFARAHARENLGLVGFDRHAAAAAVPTLTPLELFGDGVEIDMQSGRHALENDDEPLAVRLAGGEKTQHCLVILYELSALFRRDRRDPGLFSQASRLQRCVRRMATLIADRFLCRVALGPEFVVQGPLAALDLATGARVRLQYRCCRYTHRTTIVDGVVHARTRRGSPSRFWFPRKHASIRGTCETLPAHDNPFARRGRPPSSSGSSTRVRPRREFSAWRSFPDARVFRQRGFVPCDLALLDDPSRSEEVSAALARRSVVVLDWRDMPSSAALGVLRLRQLAVREFCVLARRAPSKGIHVMNAAEGRAAYGQRTAAPDPRMAQTIVEVERLLTRGRHAAAERALRGAIAAFERRGDLRARR